VDVAGNVVTLDTFIDELGARHAVILTFRNVCAIVFRVLGTTLRDRGTQRRGATRLGKLIVESTMPPAKRPKPWCLTCSCLRHYNEHAASARSNKTADCPRPPRRRREDLQNIFLDQGSVTSKLPFESILIIVKDGE